MFFLGGNRQVVQLKTKEKECASRRRQLINKSVSIHGSGDATDFEFDLIGFKGESSHWEVAGWRSAG